MGGGGLATVVLALLVQAACCLQLRHHGGPYRPGARVSRYANLDRLLSRLDHPTTTTTTTTTPAPTDDESYYDEDLEDDEENSDEDELDTEDDGPAKQDSSDGWGSEAARAGGYQPEPPPRPATGQYSRWKWEHLGSRQAIDEYRQQQQQHSRQQSFHPPGTGRYKTAASSEYDIRAAVHHAVRVNQEGSCKAPRPKVINVKDVYPHSAKAYIPHCTILHQCGDDTGCCRSDALTCTPLKTHRVDLYFYTTVLTPDGGHRNVVETLTFYNHTECHCVDRFQNMMPQDMGHVSSSWPRSEHARAERKESNCRCPSVYTARHLANGKCACECFDKQRDCLKAKRGKTYFSHQDRLCIRSSECLSPSCEFGSYMLHAGRCPKKAEKLDAWARYFERQRGN